jgi:hypothetical protein
MEKAPDIPTNWTKPEKWVWKKIASGEPADLSEYDIDHPNLAPETKKGWGENRRLSSKFLQIILTQKIFVEATPYGGVRILGALIDDAPLNLEHARLQHLFWLEKSRILVNVNCRSLRVDGGLSFEESFVSGAIHLDGAHIQESITMIGSTIDGNLSLNASKVGGGILLRKNAKFKGNLDFIAIYIGCNLELSGSTFEKEVILNSAKIAGNTFLRNATFKGNLDLKSSKIGSYLDIQKSTFEGEVNLTGCTVTGTFHLGDSKTEKKQWKNNSSLILRNTHVGTLQDWWQDESSNSWPKTYKLEGFTYNQLGLFNKTQEADMLDRPISSYVEWIKGDTNCSPQPYEHLAGRFHEAGEPQKANDILYASRERQRRNAWSTKEWKRWLGLSLLKITIGYGLGNRYFRVLWSVGLLTFIGTFVLFTSGSQSLAQFWNIFFASLDQLLPLVTLDKAHDVLIFGKDSNVCYGIKVYFYLHKILGWVLGSFLVAGLSGLTQKN